MKVSTHSFPPIFLSSPRAQGVHHIVTSWEKTPMDYRLLSGVFLSGGGKDGSFLLQALDIYMPTR